MTIDSQRKRPLELAVFHHELKHNEGCTEEEALRKDRRSADALFFIRILQDANEQHKEIMSIDGHTLLPLKEDDLFIMWLELAGHVCRQIARTLEEDSSLSEKDKHRLTNIQKTCGSILYHVSLNDKMGVLRDIEDLKN
jgi:hypothetical protein